MECGGNCGFRTNFSTNFSCNQLTAYCFRYNEWLPVADRMKASIDYTHILFGVVGILSYVAMLLVYRTEAYKSVSFIYHRAVVAMEMLHMVVMVQSGVFMSRGYTDTYAYVMYRDVLLELWVVGDGMKLGVALVTVFMSLERAVAMWHQPTFKFLNRPWVAWWAVALSTLLSGLHLLPTSIGTPAPSDDDPGTYVVRVNPLGEKITNAVWNSIYIIKIVSSVLIFVFCLMIVGGLVMRSRKLIKLTKDNWSDCKRLCVMQLITAIACLIDHGVWVFSKLMKYDTLILTGEDAVRSLDYKTANAALDMRILYTKFWVMESITGEIDHACRFFIYYACLKSFRVSVKSLVFRNQVQNVNTVTSRY